MNKVTCKQLGGPCEQTIEGETPKEIFTRAFMHIRESGDPDHQSLFSEMENMNEEECAKWNNTICNICQK